MMKTSLFPLRSIAGPDIPVASQKKGVPDIDVIHESPAAKDLHLEYRFKGRDSAQEARVDAGFEAYFPQLAPGGAAFPAGGGLTPGPGVCDLPGLPGLPFPANHPVVSLMTLAGGVSAAQAASLQVQLRIKLARKALVGGIAFAGHPFLPATSYASSNFGLPREWRLTPVGESSAGSRSANSAFLDFESSVTRQELLSHSGAHFLCCDPTWSDTILLSLSNWPRFVGHVTLRPQIGRLPEAHYGFLIPFFYVFEYREGTHYRPRAPFGLLNVRWAGYPASQASQGAEYVFRQGGHYYPFTAASLTNGRRTYSVPASEAHRKPRELRECFVSGRLNQNGKVTLLLEQSGEFERCLSGLHLLPLFVPSDSLPEDIAAAEDAVAAFLPNLNLDALASLPRDVMEEGLRNAFELPDGIEFSGHVGVRVWEVDPPEGIAPTQVTLGEKYTALLADWQVDTLGEILDAYVSGIRFRQPSSARYLAVELVNRSATPSRIVLPHLSFVQSAHVSVAARPSRFQRIRALNFRLVGEGLGDDLSRLGGNGFHFAVEHWADGERKSVLFEARSLFDLVHAGVARLQVNARRRASELEVSEYGAAVDERLGDARENYDRRSSRNYSLGWRRTESGKDLHWTGTAAIGPAQNKTPAALVPNGTMQYRPDTDFVSVSNQETRTHVRYLYPDESQAQWNAAGLFANALDVAFRAGSVLSGADPVIKTYKADGNHPEELAAGFARAWQGLSNHDLAGLRVKGATSVVQSPYALPAIAGQEVQSFVDAVSGAIQIGGEVLNGAAPDPATLGATLVDAGNVSGLAAFLAILTGTAGIPGLGAAVQAAAAAPFVLNGLTLNVSATAAGAGVTFGAAPGNLLPVVSQSATCGSQGTVTRQATQSNYSYSQVLTSGGDEGSGTTQAVEGLMKRQVTRAEAPGDQRRLRGGEVMWQECITDVVSGVIPLDVALPALASKGAFRSAGECVRVRLGSGVGADVSVDFWFDVVEEMVRDDH